MTILNIDHRQQTQKPATLLKLRTTWMGGRRWSPRHLPETTPNTGTSPDSTHLLHTVSTVAVGMLCMYTSKEFQLRFIDSEISPNHQPHEVLYNQARSLEEQPCYRCQLRASQAITRQQASKQLLHTRYQSTYTYLTTGRRSFLSPFMNHAISHTVIASGHKNSSRHFKILRANDVSRTNETYLPPSTGFSSCLLFFRATG